MISPHMIMSSLYSVSCSSLPLSFSVTSVNKSFRCSVTETCLHSACQAVLLVSALAVVPSCLWMALPASGPSRPAHSLSSWPSGPGASSPPNSPLLAAHCLLEKSKILSPRSKSLQNLVPACDFSSGSAPRSLHVWCT